MSALWFVPLAIVAGTVVFVAWTARQLTRRDTDLASLAARSQERRRALGDVRGELSRTTERIDDRR